LSGSFFVDRLAVNAAGAFFASSTPRNLLYREGNGEAILEFVPRTRESRQRLVFNDRSSAQE